MSKLRTLVTGTLIPILRRQKPAELGGWDWHGLADQLQEAIKTDVLVEAANNVSLTPQGEQTP